MRRYRYVTDYVKAHRYQVDNRLENILNEHYYTKNGWRVVSVILLQNEMFYGYYQVVFEKHETDG